MPAASSRRNKPKNISRKGTKGRHKGTKKNLISSLCLVFKLLFFSLTIPLLQAFDDAQDLAALLLEQREHEDDRGARNDTRDVPQPRPTKVRGRVPDHRDDR